MAAPTSSSPVLGEVSPDELAPEPAPGRVGVVLVSHDGARWLPTVLDGLSSQSRPPWRVVAVDTGSRDESRELLSAHPVVDSVVELSARDAFPAAVAAGLAELDAASDGHGEPDWVWLLHDDSTPAPDALLELLRAAAADPGVDLLGPKLREWPSLRRLVEVGATITGTGRREIGLERGEYDQGQHDRRRDVLAVNTAGMLVRREAWEALGGLDEALPVFGNDLDLGWRAATTGRRTAVAPAAVVFHAEAARRGVRRTPLTGRHTAYAERRAALRTLLVNCSARSLPWRVVRLAVGTLVRMVGFLLVRSPGEALDDLAALVSVYRRPGAIRAARRTRRALPRVGPDRSSELLAPGWLPYRHGLDLVGDVVAAATQQAADVAERRREERAARTAERTGTGRRNRHADDRAPAGTGDLGETEAAAPQGRGALARFLASPTALATTAFVVAALVAARAAYGEVSGGALAPAPSGAGEWWALHLSSWHELGPSGTDVPAPPYVAVLALLGTLLLGSATAAVSVVLVLAVPVALAGAWRFLRVAARLADPAGAPRPLLAAGAAAYAVVPVTSGAWAGGRVGVVVLAALLPWLAHAALGFLEPEPDRRRRAGWRTGALTTLAVAFVPPMWPVVLGLVVVGLGVGFVLSPRGMRSRTAWGPPTVALVTPVVLLAPWWVGLLRAGAPQGLLLEAGTPPVPSPTTWELLTGRLGGPPDPGSPWWWLAAVPAALAVVGLLAGRTRGAAVVCWAVGLVALVPGGLLALVRLDLGAVTVPVSVAPAVVVLAGALLAAAVLGALALPGPRALARGGATVVAAGLAVSAVGGVGWFLVDGGDLDGVREDGIPAYMTQSSLEGPERGVLVVDGDLDSGLDYVVRRGDGTTLGEAEIQVLSPPEDDAAATAAIAELLGRPSAEAVGRLPALGIEYVVLPAPADGRVAAGLDAVEGLTQAGAEDRETRAWQVETAPEPGAVDGSGPWWHGALVVGQAVLVLVVAVLCGPSRRRSR